MLFVFLEKITSFACLLGLELNCVFHKRTYGTGTILCECTTSKHFNHHCWHIIIGDLQIIENKRETYTINWEKK